jgi:hypothetical protein
MTRDPDSITPYQPEPHYDLLEKTYIVIKALKLQAVLIHKNVLRDHAIIKMWSCLI